MKIFILLFKNKFKNLIKNKKLQLFVVIISIFLLVGLFAPLFQFQLFNNLENNNFLNKSGKFEYTMTLPEKSLNQKEEEVIKKTFDIYKGKVKYSYSPGFTIVNNEQKKIYLIIKYFSSRLFNQIVDGSTGQIIKNETLDDDEVILNTKFVNSNPQFSINKNIKLGEKEYRIISKGERISDFSIGLSKTLENLMFLESFKKEDYFKNVAKIFVNTKQYDYLLNKYKKKHNQQKHIYIKFNKFVQDKEKKQIIDNISNVFSEKWNKSLIKIKSFDKDLESGLKIQINNFFNLFIYLFFAFLLLIILFIFLKFIRREIESRKNEFLPLILNGMDYKRIIIIDLFFNFLLIFFTTFFGILFGLFIGSFFYKFNYESSLLFIKENYFHYSFILVFLLFIPIFISLSSLIYQIYFYKNKILNKYYFDESLKKVEPIFVFFKKWLPIFFSKISINTLIWFNKIKRKIFLFLILMITIVLFFIILFVKISFSNFINFQNFYPSNIKSISRLNSLFLKDGTKLLKTVNFVKKDPNNKNQFVEIKKPFEVISKFLNDKNFNFNCINELINHKLGKEIKSYKCNQGIGLKIKTKYFPNKDQRELLESFGIEEIYINTAPYDSNIDFPSLMLETEIIEPEILKYKIKENFSSKFTLFLSNQEKWVDFFPDFKKTFESQGVKISKNGDFYLENDIKTTDEYIFLPESYKSLGYKVGDKIIKRFYVNKQIIHREKQETNPNLKRSDWKFKVIGFIPTKIFNQPTSIVNYNFLIKNNIVSANDKVYNFIVSKESKSYLKRNLIIDINPEKTDLKNFKNIEIINSESINLKTLAKANIKHFNIYEWYFFLILIVISLILFFIFSTIFESIIKTNKKLFKVLNLHGFSFWKLCMRESIYYFLSFFVISIISFIIGYSIFYVFSFIFSRTGIHLILFNSWQYFGYFLLVFILIFFQNLFTQYFIFINIKSNYI